MTLDDLMERLEALQVRGHGKVPVRCLLQNVTGADVDYGDEGIPEVWINTERSDE